MISDLYIKRAIKIRKEYLKLVKEINSYETIAHDLISSISDRKKDLENLLESLNQNRITNADIARQKLDEIVLQTEDDMNKVDATIDSLNKKMDKLREEEMYLYREIKQVYSDIPDDDLKIYIQEALKKQNLS
jgi:CII-binding regulator of phage lambda lysogenization HflD